MKMAISVVDLGILSSLFLVATLCSLLMVDAQDKNLSTETRLAFLEQEFKANSKECKRNFKVLNRRLETFENKLNPSRPQVGFAVKFSYEPVTSTGTRGTYVFNEVLTNVGNGYNTRTGIFTAPISGLYAIHFNFMSVETGGGVHLVIMKETAVVGNVYGGGSDDKDDQSSTTVVLLMQQGEQVWVRHEWGNTAIRGGPWTLFSGFLVQAQ